MATLKTNGQVTDHRSSSVYLRIRSANTAEPLVFPGGAVTQGFDLPDARLIIAGALEDLAQLLLQERRPLPAPSEEAHSSEADLIELVPLSVDAGTISR